MWWLFRQYKTKFLWSLNLTSCQEILRSLAGTTCRMVELAVLKCQPSHGKRKKKEGKGDWKINGVCDWQPMILGIRLNWIRQRESVGHNPRIHWDTLIVNIQKHFLPSLSLGYKAWSQNTSSPLEPHSLKGIKSKPAQAFETSQPLCADT